MALMAFLDDSCPLVRARACRGVLVQGGLRLTLGWRAVPWEEKVDLLRDLLRSCVE